MRYRDRLAWHKARVQSRVQKELKALGARYPRLKNLFDQFKPELAAKYSDVTLDFVDLFFVSKIGIAAVAGVGIVASILFIPKNLVPAGAVKSLISQSLGGRNKIAADEKSSKSSREQVEQVITQAMWLPIMLGAIVGFCSLCGVGILYFVGESAATREAAKFLSIAGGLSVLGFVFQMERGILRGLNEKKSVTRASWSMNIINGLLNPLLIWQVGLGVVGSALATVIANLFGVVYLWCAIFFKLNPWEDSLPWDQRIRWFRRKSCIILEFGDDTRQGKVLILLSQCYFMLVNFRDVFSGGNMSWKVDWHFQKKMKDEYLPGVFSNLTLQSALKFVEMMLATYGMRLFAGLKITDRMRMWICTPFTMAIPMAVGSIVSMYFGTALDANHKKQKILEPITSQTMLLVKLNLLDLAVVINCGYSYGHKKEIKECHDLDKGIKVACREAVRYCTLGIGLVVAVQVTLWLFQFLFGEWLIRLFTDDPQAIKVAMWALPMYIGIDTFWGVQRVGNEALRGVSFNTKFITRCMYVTSGLLIIGVVLAINLGWGFQRLFYLQGAYTAINATIAVGRFYSRKWIPS